MRASHIKRLSTSGSYDAGDPFGGEEDVSSREVKTGDVLSETVTVHAHLQQSRSYSEYRRSPRARPDNDGVAAVAAAGAAAATSTDAYGEGTWFFSSVSRRAPPNPISRRARPALKTIDLPSSAQQHHPSSSRQQAESIEYSAHDVAVAARTQSQDAVISTPINGPDDMTAAQAGHTDSHSQQSEMSSRAAHTVAMVAPVTDRTELPIRADASRRTNTHRDTVQSLRRAIDEETLPISPTANYDLLETGLPRSSGYGTFECEPISTSSSQHLADTPEFLAEPQYEARAVHTHGRVSGMHAAQDSSYSNTLLGRYGTEPIDGYLNISARCVVQANGSHLPVES